MTPEAAAAAGTTVMEADGAGLIITLMTASETLLAFSALSPSALVSKARSSGFAAL